MTRPLGRPISRLLAFLLLLGPVLALGCASEGTEPETPSITVSVSASSATVQQGAATELTVTVTGSGGFSGTATVTVQNVPSGVTGSVSNVQTSGATTTGTVTITVDASAAPGTYDLTVRASGTGVAAASASFSLTVTAAPSYTLSATPGQLAIEQGASASTDIGIARTNFTGDITLSIEGAPAGMGTSFDTNPVSGNTTTLTVSPNGTVAPNTYTLTVRGTATGLADRTVALDVLVTEPAVPDYLLTLDPAALTVMRGASDDTNVTLTRTNFTAAVTLSVEGLPAGVTASFSDNPVSGNTSTLTLDVAGSTDLGQHALTVRGTATGFPDKTATLTLTVEETAAYTLSLDPTAVTIAQSASGTVDVTLSRTNFTEAVDLSLEGAPAGVNGSFSVDPLSGNASVLTIDVGPSVVPGDYTLTVRGTSTLADRTAQVVLTVPEPAGFSIAPIAGVSVQQGQSATRTVTIERTGGFSGDVTVTVTDLPAGITASVDPVTTAGASVEVTVNVAGTVGPGSYTGTVRGNATGLPESTQTLGITVTQAVGQQVTLDFAPCEVGDRPIWFAYQDGNGPWTPLTGSNDAYTFSVASNEFAVAAATTPGAGQSIVFVAYSTQAEANTFSSEDLCDPVPTGKTVNVTVAGLDPLQGESAILSLGEADIFAFANGAAQFTNVPDGNLDLVAYRSHPTGITDRMVLVRDLNPADNGSVGTIDFATDGFAPGTADITIGGGGALTTWLIEYATSPSAGFCYYSGRLTSGSAGAQFTVPGAPPAQQQAGDYHVVTMSSLLGSSFASVSESFATLANRTVSFGGIVPAPTITDLSGSGNYRRVLAEVTLPAEYNDGVSIAVTDQGADRSISALASPGRIGGGNVSLEIPDFSGVAGWNDAWAPTSASTSDWGFSAFGWTGADCVEGAREVRSLQTGTVG